LVSVAHETRVVGATMGGMEHIAVYAQQQFGVVSRKQLVEAGLRRSSIAWKLKSGELERVHEFAHRLRGSPQCWQRTAMEGMFIGGPSSVLSHATAAWLHRLDGFKEPTIIDVSRPGGHSSTVAAIRFHRTAFCSPPPVFVHAWRITAVQRTLVDLSAVLEDEALEMALDSACRRYPQTGDWLARYVQQLKPQGTPGLTRLMALMKLRTGSSTDSALEVRVLRTLRAVGLTPTDFQLEVVDRDGSFVMRLDFAWAALKIALHVDGYLWHHQRARFDRDAKQRSRLQALGWRFVTVTARNVQDANWLDDLRALLDPQHALPLGWRRSVRSFDSVRP
jgi:G:T-mismatch repair DNA endonuclease (very short patch repair protein)